MFVFIGLGLPYYCYSDELVDFNNKAKGVLLDMRYYGPHNFVGRRIKGYNAPKCLLTSKASDALAKVQNEISPFGLSLKIYDCYRPQKAVNDFVAWAKDLSDTKMKSEFYPNEEKKELFKKGYIASKSAHSRGSTVDLTIVSTSGDLDMGSKFDYFGTSSNTRNPNMSEVQKRNRLLLKTVMEKNGFVNYEKEWWHYTLKKEPYPNDYFDIDVE